MDSNHSEKRWRGRALIVATATVTLIAVTYFYNTMMAPQWIRDFGLDIAARATIVSTTSETTVFSTMRGRPEPDSPYICMQNHTPFSWDRVFVVPSGGTNLDALIDLEWETSSREKLRQQMKSDDRYQLIAFVSRGRVIEHRLYYTLWADLSALGRHEGFSRQEAVFLADSDGEIYTLTVADNAPPNACLN